jgi:hypothetical protein
MDGHDRSAAFSALEAALAISPSSALTYILGSVVLGWSGKAERAIEWSERSMRLLPARRSGLPASAPAISDLRDIREH